jgi:anti-anti-sigma factor
MGPLFPEGGDTIVTTDTRLAPPSEVAEPPVAAEDPTVISARGDLDAVAGRALRAELRSAVTARLVILDLSQVGAIDFPAIGAIIGFIRDIHERDGQAVIVTVPGVTFALLDRVGITRLVPVLTALDDAKDHLRASGVEPDRRTVGTVPSGVGLR